MKRLALLLAVVAGAVAPVAAHAVVPGANGLIAFATDAGLFSVNPDGSGQTQVPVTPPLTFYGNPAWSPDATKIAFDVFAPGMVRHIAVVNADGTNLVSLTGTTAVSLAPAWSPDGSKIAYTQQSQITR
jgi:Tol biopolymer transport system component